MTQLFSVKTMCQKSSTDSTIGPWTESALSSYCIPEDELTWVHMYF